MMLWTLLICALALFPPLALIWGIGHTLFSENRTLQTAVLAWVVVYFLAFYTLLFLPVPALVASLCHSPAGRQFVHYLGLSNARGKRAFFQNVLLLACWPAVLAAVLAALSRRPRSAS